MEFIARVSTIRALCPEHHRVTSRDLRRLSRPARNPWASGPDPEGAVRARVSFAPGRVLEALTRAP